MVHDRMLSVIVTMQEIGIESMKKDCKEEFLKSKGLYKYMF